LVDFYQNNNNNPGGSIIIAFQMKHDNLNLNWNRVMHNNCFRFLLNVTACYRMLPKLTPNGTDGRELIIIFAYVVSFIFYFLIHYVWPNIFFQGKYKNSINNVFIKKTFYNNNNNNNNNILSNRHLSSFSMHIYILRIS